MKPIFFAWTKSFWLSVAGILLIVAEMPHDAVRAALVLFARIISPVVGYAPADIADALVDLVPVLLWVAAIQQRSGAARPYTADPTALK